MFNFLLKHTILCGDVNSPLVFLLHINTSDCDDVVHDLWHTRVHRPNIIWKVNIFTKHDIFQVKGDLNILQHYSEGFIHKTTEYFRYRLDTLIPTQDALSWLLQWCVTIYVLIYPSKNNLGIMQNKLHDRNFCHFKLQ